jgi:hypothetical protein
MMSRIVFRLLVALAFALSLVAAAERAVLAAPPANDVRSGATLVTAGFSESLNTSEATTDADDANMKLLCNFPATDASVWYEFVGTGEKFRLEVFRSDYSASIIILGGNFINPHIGGCGVGGMDFSTTPGEHYYLLAFDDQRDGVGTGGMLNISISVAPPPPDLTVKVSADRFEVNARTGVVTISGTYSCVNADSIIFNVDASQELGKVINILEDETIFRAWGDSFLRIDGTCDGALHPWSTDVYPFLDPSFAYSFRRFGGGKAMVGVTAHSEGPYGWSNYTVIQHAVILRRKG